MEYLSQKTKEKSFRRLVWCHNNLGNPKNLTLIELGEYADIDIAAAKIAYAKRVADMLGYQLLDRKQITDYMFRKCRLANKTLLINGTAYALVEAPKPPAI